MSKHDKYLIPKDIEQAVPILGAHPVDLSFSIMMFAFGIVAKSMLISLIMMVLVLVLLSKLRKGAKRGYSQHYLWRIGLSSFDKKLGENFPDPSINDFIR